MAKITLNFDDEGERIVDESKDKELFDEIMKVTEKYRKVDDNVKECIDCGVDCSDCYGHLEGKEPLCIDCFIKNDEKLLGGMK